MLLQRSSLWQCVRGPRDGRCLGFTLTEIMVVVVILTLLALVGVQQFRRARIVAYEQFALNSLRLLTKSCQMFYLVKQRYPTALTELGTETPPYINDATLLAGTKQGYVFT